MRPKVLYIIFVFILFNSCFQAENLKRVDALDKSLELNNGILYEDNKRFTGFIVAHFEDSRIKSETLYRNGRKHGCERQWHDDRNLVSERYYSKGKKVGIHKGWWQNGNLKFELHFNNDGAYHGLVKEWYESGQIFRHFNYQNGREVGTQQLWKPDGRIKANYQVVHGERFGLIGLKKCFTVSANNGSI